MGLLNNIFQHPLTTGEVSMRNLLPALMTRPLTFLENHMSPWMMKKTAMFAIVVLKKSVNHKT